MGLVEVFTTTLTSAFDVFKYVSEKYGSPSEEMDKLMDVFHVIFPEELSSELQRKFQVYQMEKLADSLVKTDV